MSLPTAAPSCGKCPSGPWGHAAMLGPRGCTARRTACRTPRCTATARQSARVSLEHHMALKITVIGTGYLGATHAAAMAELGFEVLGLDVVPEKIEMLSAGRVPMYEPGLEELLRRHVAGIEGSTGRLRFTMDWAEVAEFGDVHFVCVNTPQKHGEYACDMSYVDSAVESLAKHLGQARAGRRQVHGARGQRRAARRPHRRTGARRARRGAGLEPGVPARGLRRTGHTAPRPDRGGRTRRARRAAAARGVRDTGRRRIAVRRHRLPDLRAGEDLRELVPRHEDLVHQRDGRGLRGHAAAMW